MPPPKKPSSAVVGTFALFRNLSMPDLATVAAHMHLQNYSVGNYIINAETKDTDVYFLVSGNVKVCVYSLDGKHVHFDDLESGSMFGEIAAIDRGGRSSDCIAADDVVAAVLPRDRFLRFYNDFPAVREALLLRLTGIIRFQMQRVFELTSCTVGQRIRFELLRIASIEKSHNTVGTNVQISSPPTHEEIANRIGTRREAVTKELKSLEAQGVIVWKPGDYRIVDKERLLALASGK